MIGKPAPKVKHIITIIPSRGYYSSIRKSGPAYRSKYSHIVLVLVSSGYFS